jgi:hypothetical protein
MVGAGQKESMTLNVKRVPISAFEAVVIEAVVTYGRRSAHFLYESLQGAYATHLERAQMRFAPFKPRSWRENLPGAHDDYSRPQAYQAPRRIVEGLRQLNNP